MNSLFHNLELLPIAYFIVVMWVVCSGVLGKLFGGYLISATSGPLRQMLSKRINVAFTGDTIVDSLFESCLLAGTRRRLLLVLLPHFRHKAEQCKLLVFNVVHIDSCRERLFRGHYWSGCPPNCSLPLKLSA